MNKKLREKINLAELYKKVPNRFLLTVAAAKRARQIDDGARPLIDNVSLSNEKSLDIALMEIQLGKINVFIDESSDNGSILDEISDYLDSDSLLPDPVDPHTQPSPKRKQSV
jgi:DNA-directed RNA polymerase subunit omega